MFMNRVTGTSNIDSVADSNWKIVGITSAINYYNLSLPGVP
jgi:hypothetical protein